MMAESHKKYIQIQCLVGAETFGKEASMQALFLIQVINVISHRYNNTAKQANTLISVNTGVTHQC